TQPLTVRMDPRVKATAGTLTQQSTLSGRLIAAMASDTTALGKVRALRRALKARRLASADSTALDALDREAAELETGASAALVNGRAPENLTRINGEMRSLYLAIQGSDQSPTAVMIAGVAKLESALAELNSQIEALRARVAK